MLGSLGPVVIRTSRPEPRAGREGIESTRRVAPPASGAADTTPPPPTPKEIPA